MGRPATNKNWMDYVIPVLVLFLWPTKRYVQKLAMFHAARGWRGGS